MPETKRDAVPDPGARPRGLLARIHQWVATDLLGAVLVLTPVVVAAEFLAMWLVERVLHVPGLVHAGADTILSIAVLVPVLVALFVLPAQRNLQRSLNSEQALRITLDQLEARVQERTAELQAANARLRQEEAKYSSLVEGSPTGIFIAQQGRLEYVNPRLAEMTGEVPGRLAGRMLLPLLHPDDRDRLRWLGEANGQGGAIPNEVEGRLLTHGDQVRSVEMRCIAIDYQGRPAILGNVQDVTEHRRMEAELRYLSGRLLAVQEEERRRVARDLHDSLGQTLTGIKFTVEAALGPPWPNERRLGMRRLQALVPVIQEAVEEVRRISTELRPSILDDLGLLPTIAWYLRDLGQTHPGLTIGQRIEVDEAGIPKDLRTPIYRILQEATTNVVKHSGASRIDLGLGRRDGELRLSLQDNGRGFTPRLRPDPLGTLGSGLSSMRERAELSGGRFSVVAGPGAGTSIQVVWPLEGRPSG